MRPFRIGDWVRVNPAYKMAQTGVGHILDGHYADDPPHLIQEARVRFPLWKDEGYWYAAGDLLPLSSIEELRVFDAALSALALDPETRDGLERAREEGLARVRDGRPPGLLSTLWALRPEGLEEFLGRDLAAILREAPQRPIEPFVFYPSLAAMPAPAVPKPASSWRPPLPDATPAFSIPLSRRQQKKAAYRARLAAAKQHAIEARSEGARSPQALGGGEDVGALKASARDKLARGDFLGALQESVRALRATLDASAR